MKKLHFLLAVLTVGLTLLSCEKEPIEPIAETPEVSVASDDTEGDIQKKYGVMDYVSTYWEWNSGAGKHVRREYLTWCLSWHAMNEFKNHVHWKKRNQDIPIIAKWDTNFNWRCRLVSYGGDNYIIRTHYANW